jgi:regulator of cell morphogenesis and NO signaling
LRILLIRIPPTHPHLCAPMVLGYAAALTKGALIHHMRSVTPLLCIPSPWRYIVAMMIVSLQESTGNAAARQKEVRDLFEELGLDYYCEGDLTIAEAARAAGLDVLEVEARLKSLAGRPASRWPDRSLAELVGHLESEHHAVARDLIAHTALLLDDVCRPGGDARLPAVRAAFRALSEQLIVHMEREELTIFPAIMALEQAWTKGQPPAATTEGGIRKLLGQVLLEHSEISHRLRELRHARMAFSETGNTVLTRLFERLMQLERHLHEYMNLESYVAFPRAIAIEDALHLPSPAAASQA